MTSEQVETSHIIGLFRKYNNVCSILGKKSAFGYGGPPIATIDMKKEIEDMIEPYNCKTYEEFLNIINAKVDGR